MTQSKIDSEIGLVCIYTLSPTHGWRSVVIICMFGCICSISYSSVFIIWIRSRNLFTYFVAILRGNCRWPILLILLNMNVSFTLLSVLHIVILSSTHYTAVRFYFRWLMNNTIIGVLNVIWWMQCSLQTITVDSITRL